MTCPLSGLSGNLFVPFLAVAPKLFRTLKNVVLREFIGIHGDQIESMRSEPDLKNTEKLTLRESDENIARMEPIKLMEPMKPMTRCNNGRVSQVANTRSSKT